MSIQPLRFRLPTTGHVAAALCAAALLWAPVAAADPGSGLAVDSDPALVGLAGAGVANGVGAAALHANPAAMGQIRQYAVSIGYGHAAEPANHGFTLSATDSLLNPNMALGFAYTFQLMKIRNPGLLSGLAGEEVKSGRAHRLRAALALGERGQSLSYFLGVAPHFQDEDAGNIDRSVFNLDVGLLIRFADMISVGVVGANLLDATDDGQPRQVAGGIGVSWEMLQLGYDVRVAFDAGPDGDDALSHAVGLQVAPVPMLPLRAGYRADGALDADIVSGGLGWYSPVVGFDFAYAQAVGGETRRWILATLRVFVSI